MRSPNWREEEVMLALDLYINRELKWIRRMSDSTFEIVALSRMLNALDLIEEKPENFRSTGSIRMKLANFMALDERYESHSLANVGSLDRKVWNDYAKRPKELHRECMAIINEHLRNSSKEIDQYIELMELGKSNDSKTVDVDFASFTKSLMRTLSYYEELVINNSDLPYSREVARCCENIKRELVWTNDIGEIVLDYEEYKEHAGVNLRPVKKRVKKTDDEGNSEEKVGKLIQRTFRNLVAQDKLTDEVVEKLLSHKYSKDTFGIKPTFLIKIDNGKDIKAQITDENGYVRYWTTMLMEVINLRQKQTRWRTPILLL